MNLPKVRSAACDQEEELEEKGAFKNHTKV